MVTDGGGSLSWSLILVSYDTVKMDTKNSCPPGRPVTTHVDPFQNDERVLTEAEVEVAVSWLRRNRTDTHTKLWDEHL